MVSTAPDPVDVTDFQFKVHCKLKIFGDNAPREFKDVCSLVAVAYRFGLIFVGTPNNELQVIQVKHIEDLMKDISSYKRRTVQLESKCLHISVNCDCTKLAVIITAKDGCPVALVYDVTSFFKQNLQLLKTIRLSSAPGCKVLSCNWNPALPDIFTACNSDGTLGVYEFKGSAMDYNQLPASSGAQCFCWSPKGKQIAVGSIDGKITQYKPDLKAVKVIEPPSGFNTMIELCWLSSFQFVGVFKNSSGECSLICIDAPKAGPPVYTNYDDICYSNGNVRPQQFYLMHQQHWNVVMVASSNSMEIGVLGINGDKWTQWILNDNSRAELPLSIKGREDTFPVGAVFSVAAHKYIQGDGEIKHAPELMILSNDGVLCTFYTLNLKPGALDICSPLERVADYSGESLYTFEVAKPSVQHVAPRVDPAVLKPIHQAMPAFAAPMPKLNVIPQEKPNQIPGFMPATTAPLLKPSGGAILPPTSKSQIPEQIVKPTQQAPKPELLKTPLSQSRESVASTKLEISAMGKLPIDSEMEAMIAQLVNEECCTLELELKNVLRPGSSVLSVGTDEELRELMQRVIEVEEFYNAIKETINSLDNEVYTLKQSLMQTWACYEDARSRFETSRNPLTKVLLQSLPLDPASQFQQEEISRMMFYIESQLSQANQCLDEQWDTFQDALMKSNQLKIPTLESVYQTMVRHSKTLQKQRYLLKHIANRMKISKRTTLMNAQNEESSQLSNLQHELSTLNLQSKNKLTPEFNRIIERQSKLTDSKLKQLYDVLTNRQSTHVYVSKPNLTNSTIQLASLLAAPISPIAAGKTAHPVKLDFVNSTPKPSELKEIKMLRMPVQSSPFNTSQSSIVFKMGPVETSTPSPSTTAFTPIASSTTTNQSKSATSIFSSTLVSSAPATKTLFGTNLSSSSSTIAFKFGEGVNTGFKFGASTPTTTTVVTTPTTEVKATSSGVFGPVKPALLATPSTAPIPVAVASIFGGTTSSTTSNDAPPKQTTTTSFFGKVGTASTALTPTPGIFGSKPSSGGSMFGVVPKTTAAVFGGTSVSAPSVVRTTSGKTTTTSIFGGSPGTTTTSSIFGGSLGTATTSSIFGGTSGTTTSISGGTPRTTTTSSIFGGTSGAKTTSSSIFGGTSLSFSSNLSSTASPAPTSSIFSFGTPPATKPLGETPATSSTTKPTTPKPTSSAATTVATTAAVISTSTLTIVSSSVPSFTIPRSTTTTSAPTTSSTPGIFSMAKLATSTPTIFGSTSITATTSAPLIKPAATVPTTTAPPATGSFTFTTSATSAETTTSAPSKPIFAATTTSLFATPATTTSSSGFGSIFGGTQAVPTSSTPGNVVASTPATTTSSSTGFGSIFGGTQALPTSTTPGTVAKSPVFATTTTTGTTSIFGSVATTTTGSTSIFGSAATTSSSALTSGAATTFASSPFGGGSTNISSTSVFGQTPTGSPFAPAATSTTSPFGQAPSATVSPFGQTGTTSTSSSFGQPVTSAVNVFGQTASSAAPAFGQNVSSTGSPFGSTVSTTSTPFGGSSSTAFSSTGSLFGQPSNFGTASVFGGGTTSAFGTGSVFGTPSTTSSSFGTTTFGSTSPFGATATTSSSGFSSPQSQTTFGNNFSGDNSFASPNQGSMFGGSFGSLSVGGAPSGAFGQTATSAANPFRTPDSKSTFGTSSNIFGSGASASQSIFGAPATTQSTFGSNSPFSNTNTSFGQPSTFGSSSFGTAPAGAFSGGSQSVQQTGFGSPNFQKPAFGSAPVFGQQGFGGSPSFGSAPTFGGGATFGSPQKPAFGTSSSESSTFGSIANQNVVGFGNLAQQATQPAQPSFSGGSSFTNWRN